MTEVGVWLPLIYAFTVLISDCCKANIKYHCKNCGRSCDLAGEGLWDDALDAPLPETSSMPLPNLAEELSPSPSVSPLPSSAPPRNLPAASALQNEVINLLQGWEKPPPLPMGDSFQIRETIHRAPKIAYGASSSAPMGPSILAQLFERFSPAKTISSVPTHAVFYISKNSFWRAIKFPRIFIPRSQVGLYLAILAGAMLVVFITFFVAGIFPRNAVYALLNGSSRQGVQQAALMGTGAMPGLIQTAAHSGNQLRILAVGIETSLSLATSTSGISKQLKGDMVMHYPGSALPSEPSGNVLIFGRAPFARIGNLKNGDQIEIIYNGNLYVYRTTRVKILKSWETEEYVRSLKKILTLSTALPDSNPASRITVEGEFVGKHVWRAAVRQADTLEN